MATVAWGRGTTAASGDSTHKVVTTLCTLSNAHQYRNTLWHHTCAGWPVFSITHCTFTLYVIPTLVCLGNYQPPLNRNRNHHHLSQFTRTKYNFTKSRRYWDNFLPPLRFSRQNPVRVRVYRPIYIAVIDTLLSKLPNFRM